MRSYGGVDMIQCHTRCDRIYNVIQRYCIRHNIQHHTQGVRAYIGCQDVHRVSGRTQGVRTYTGCQDIHSVRTYTGCQDVHRVSGRT